MPVHYRKHRFPIWSSLVLLVVGAGAVFAGAAVYKYARGLFYPSQDAVATFAGRMKDPAFIERGRYLANAADCAACHTAEGGQPFAGGAAFATPFGTIYSPNITSDDTGIGAWTDQQFVRALHKGINERGRAMYPAFPYPSYTRTSIEDAMAIKAYLFSLPKARHKNRPNELEFPFNQRWLMIFWNLLYFQEGPLPADTRRDAAWHRGRFLVEALGHCGDCHTPRNRLMGPTSAKFAGAAVEKWWAYNITPAGNAGIGNWAGGDLERYLATGVASGHGAASGPMAEVVENSTSLLTEDDRKAMAAYLRTIPPIENGGNKPRNQWGGPATDVVAERGHSVEGRQMGVDDGARLFVANCASCHGWNGGGVGGAQPGAYPSLFHNGNVGGGPKANLLNVLLQGVARKTPGADVFMPGFAGVLNDSQLAGIANYVLHQFGNPADANVQPGDISALRGRPAAAE